MAIKKQVEYTPPLKARLWKWFKGLIYYPHKIAKRFAAYNYSVGEMIMETNNGTFDAYRRRNSLLVNSMIYLPMFIGFVGTFLSMYSHKEDFFKYWKLVTAPVKYSGVFNMIGEYVGRVVDIVTKLPFNALDYQLFIWFYGLAIFFAWVLSKHTAFKEEERIVHIFATLGYVDSEGKPWRVTWTPDAIMITAFNCDPVALCANNRFWSSVNFPPSPPKVFRTNMNKFIVMRKYELPAKMEFIVKPEDV